MKYIFEKLYNTSIKDGEECYTSKILHLFLSEDPVITTEFIPIIDASLENEEFQKNVILSYKEKVEKDLQSAVNDKKKWSHYHKSSHFFESNIERIKKNLEIKNIDQLKEHFHNSLESGDLLDIINSYYKAINDTDGTEYIKQNYAIFSIGELLYNKYESKKNSLIDYSDIVKSEYEKIDIDIEKEDLQFSKYKIISINENIEISNCKDSQTIKDRRINKYFWIDIGRNLLSKIESLINDKAISHIAFRIDYVSDYVPAMEEKEFGTPMRINISDIPSLSKFYSTENYNNNLWVKHDKIKKSLTFEETLESHNVFNGNVITQVVHLEYTKKEERFFITHLDHERITYTPEQYKQRTFNADIKGYKKEKTFKIDDSMIPFHSQNPKDMLLVQVLDYYFKNTDLVNEYFEKIG